MNEKTCENCRYYYEHYCPIVLWEDGQQVRIGTVEPEQDGCGLWEERNE